MKSIRFRDVDLTKDEKVYRSTKTWAFDLRYLWLSVVSLVILYFLPLPLWSKLILLVIILWYSSYSFRQLWKLTLTNKRIIAKRIYPRPLDYFLSKIHNFPYQHLEGISTGPRNNVALFVVGLTIATNLGLNLLKSSLSASELELPDTLEFILFIALLLPPYAREGEQIQLDVQEWYQHFAGSVLRTAGIISLVAGVMLMLISFPWKQFLVLRIRYAKDFKLRTSISNKFIAQLSELFHESETTKLPEQFAKWHFPWLKDEKVEAITDMEQIQYLTRLIGLFALTTGVIRLWIGFRDLGTYSSTEFWLWVTVTMMDLLTIYFSIKYSKRSSEFVVTNKRIIFAQEVRQLSGLIGKRYFFISDLKRRDIAGFEFNRITAFALEYLLSAILVSYIAITLLFTNFILLAAPFLLFALFLFLFVYQTFVGFSIKTKSGDKWVMRHQLANPATRLRQFIGDDTSIFSKLLANRLEEKKIINTVQMLRSSDVGYKAKKFEQTIQQSIDNLEKDEITLNDEFSTKRFGMKRRSLKRLGSRNRGKIKRKRIQLSLDDILLQDEDIVWEKIIPFPLNYKFLSMAVGTLFFIISLPTVFFLTAELRIDVERQIFELTKISPGLFTICMILVIVTYVFLQIKYFSLRRKSLIITRNRVFYEELVRPPKWLFFIGIFRESYIKEALIDQLQSISSGKYRAVDLNWQRFKKYFVSTVVMSIIWFGFAYLYLLANSLWASFALIGHITAILKVTMIGLGLGITWSASNMGIQLVQSWPTLELTAEGIGVKFTLPYLTQSQAEHAQYALWSGVGPQERLRQTIERKRLERRKKMKKEINQNE